MSCQRDIITHSLQKSEAAFTSKEITKLLTKKVTVMCLTRNERKKQK